MIKLKGKTMAILFAVILTLSMEGSMILIPTTSAHSPAWQIPTYSFCSVSPNPIGKGQTVNVNFWVNEPPPTASNTYGDRWQGMTVLVTLPDKTTTTLGPFTSDDTGGSYTTYTPTQVGNYTFQMSYPGQTLANNNPAPGAPTNAFVGDYYQPSTSNVFTITVQQTAISYLPVTPLPTSYWTRPINALNNNWYSIAGNWLGLGADTFSITGMYNASGSYNPYTTAPTTSHILWTKPVAFGGTVGGEFGGSETSNFYATSQYEPKFDPIIMNGIIFYNMFPGSSTYSTGWAAVNLQTGQTIWTKNTTEFLRCGQILDFVSPNQYGSIGYLWSVTASGSSPSISSAGVPVSYTYKLYDAMTGDYILSIVNATSMTLTEDSNGDLIGYFINSTSNTLNMWNSTQAILYPTGYIPGVSNLSWKWRPTLTLVTGLTYAYTGTTISFKNGIMWSVPLPTNISGQPLKNPAKGLNGLAISAVNSGTVLMTETLAGITNSGFEPGWQIETGYSAITGQQLWAPVNRTEVPYSIIDTGSIESGSGVYVEISQATLSISGYSLTTGTQLWGPTALPNTNPFSSLGADAVVANGTIYIWGYGGDVYSYNILTGALNWQYHTPSGGLESPYGVESLWTFNVGTVAGGELFLPEGHMYSPPLFHGAQQLALNITNGKVVWSIDAFDVTSAPAVSDGIATTLNAYDNQIYAWGMGPTKTTVTAPDIGVTTATPVTITGSVMDISAGSQQQAVAANFPNGLPCVSDASMSQWMEFVYEQQPCPTNVTGVPVTLSVIDANGNNRPIGTTTTNGMGTFAYTWTPDISGNYTVIATFAGTNAYYGSSADTYFYASSPPATPAPTATPVTGLATMSALTYGIAAAIIVIIIAIAIVGLLLLRKKP